MEVNDRIVTPDEFMKILNCGETFFFSEICKRPEFPPDTGMYKRRRTWWLSDVNDFIERMKDSAAEKKVV